MQGFAQFGVAPEDTGPDKFPEVALAGSSRRDTGATVSAERRMPTTTQSHLVLKVTVTVSDLLIEVISSLISLNESKSIF